MSLHQSLVFSLAAVVSVPLAGYGCKSEKPKQEPKQEQAEEVKAEKKEAPAPKTKVTPDVGLMDQAVNALADATLAASAKDGEAGGLPKFKGAMGIACGDDEQVATALKHIGMDAAPLKARKGFGFEDVCLGWRPYIKPRTEIFWMISGGEETGEEMVMAHRRCVRIYLKDDAYVKEEVVEGPCLSVHKVVQPPSDPVVPGDGVGKPGKSGGKKAKGKK